MDRGVKLFLIPYAGGNSSAYRCFLPYLNPNIIPVFVELPGHGMRMNEKLEDSIMGNVMDIFSHIKPELDGTPFIFFGHSMGTLIEYEVIKLIEERKGMKPIHAFFSGRYTPDVFTGEEHYKLPDNMFFEMLKLYGGTPDDFYHYPELVKTFLPILRNDYKAVETYTLLEKKVFEFDITALAGSKDYIVSKEQLDIWKTYSSGKCDIHIFHGNHFFLFKDPKPVCELINNIAEKWLEKEDENGELQ